MHNAKVSGDGDDDDWEYQTRESDIYSVKVKGDNAGQMTQVTNKPGGEYGPVISPDGKKLAYVSIDNKKLAYRNRILEVLDLGTNKNRQLTADLDNSASGLKWSENNSGLYYQMTERGLITVGYSTLSGRHMKIVEGLGGTTIGRPYAFANFDVDADVVAYTKGSAQRPADIFVRRKGKDFQISSLNEDLLGHKTLAQVEEVVYQSSIDGEEIQGWYLLPHLRHL